MKKLASILLALILFARVGAQVNVQTGSATYSLPVFNWNDNKSRLNLNIGLSYNSGNGLKASDVASCVGQGWNMLAGGSIIRMQAGEPDDQYPREGTIEDLTKYPPGYLYTYAGTSPNQGCPDVLNQYPIFKAMNRLYKRNNNVEADRELDYFSFQFNGRTGIFVLDKSTDKGVCLGDSRIKISFSRNTAMSYGGLGIRTAISAFYIQDENGLIYKFTTKALSKVLKMSYTDPKLIGRLVQPSFEDGGVYHEAGFEDVSIENPYVVDGWYLSEIEDALTHSKVFLNYGLKNIDAIAGVDFTYNQGQDNKYVVITHNRSITVTPTITGISTPDGHEVHFNYGKVRADLNGAEALTSIDVTYQGRYISKFKLNTTYFVLNRYGNAVSDYQKQVARLCLQSVTQYGPDLKAHTEPYTFDYYMGSSNADDFIPPPFSPFKDIWGFYNGSYSKDFFGGDINPATDISQLSFQQLKGLCFLRNSTGNNVTINPKNGYAKNGLLKQIKFPTGGSLTYEYEQNSATLGSSYGEVGGVHVLHTKMVDGGYSDDCEHPLITTYHYNKEGSSESSLWGLEMPRNMMTSYSHYSPESKYWTWKGGLFGSCRYRYQYPGILSRDQAIDLSSCDEMKMIIGDVMGAISTIMAVVDVIKLAFVSTGWGAIVSVALDVIFGLYSLIKSCKTNMDKDSSTDVFYSSDLNGANPLPSQFSRVVVVQGNGTNGSTAFTFTNPYTGTSLTAAYPLWDAGTNPLLSRKQRYANWAYGLPLKTTVFDAAGLPVKETENVYSYANAKRAFETVSGTPDYPSCKCMSTRSVSKRDDQWFNPSFGYITTTSGGDIQAERYGIYSGRVELTETYERTFKPGSSTNTLEKFTAFGYNAINLQVNHIEVMQSDGQKNYTDITFSCDYSTGVLAQLNNANIIAAPVSQVNSIRRASEEWANRYMLQETATEYLVLANGDIKPSRSLIQRTAEPIISTSWSGYPGPSGTLSPLFKEAKKFSYESNGNLVGIEDEGHRYLTNIYDYSDKYVSAVVVNAQTGVFPSACTSFETGSLGGWSLGGTPVYNDKSVTGNRGLSLSEDNRLMASLNVAKKYRLSFWAYTGSSINVSGSLTPVKSAPTINGFTYYEYETPLDWYSSVTVTGTGVIDELRLYPITAMAKTVTYDPLIGKTSECDENNRITYYEYDEMGRLRFVKDDKRDIVKMYEYNTVRNTCSQRYENKAINETYTKNNCPADHMGTSITYTIPAGRYVSANSQYEADLLAQAELDKNGQAAANGLINGIAGGECLEMFYNDEMESGTEGLYPDDGICPVGWSSPRIRYVVPAKKYWSTISKAAANQMAQDDINANGQAYANDHADCSIVITTPIYEADDPASIQCIAGKVWVYVQDINPNSSTYTQWSWQETEDTCP